jgi:hypothetical protein
MVLAPPQGDSRQVSQTETTAELVRRLPRRLNGNASFQPQEIDMLNDITERLEERAISYEQSGPSAHHTAALLREAKAEIERLRQFEPSPHPDGHDLR